MLELPFMLKKLVGLKMGLKGLFSVVSFISLNSGPSERMGMVGTILELHFMVKKIVQFCSVLPSVLLSSFVLLSLSITHNHFNDNYS